MGRLKAKELASKAIHSKRVFGHELRVGDVLTDLWHSPVKEDRIVALLPYHGSLKAFREGARLATFTVASAMTIETNTLYSVMQKSSPLEAQPENTPVPESGC